MKIRKHKGINQQTGKLKKGFKYSGKKLKSGLPEIIRVKKQKGGKVLGKGSYGCVIEPAIPCSKKLKENVVSKIGLDPDERDYDEFNIGKKLSKIDPESKYFVYVTESCDIPRSAINDADFKKCKFELGKEYQNMIMEKGSMNFHELKSVKKDDDIFKKILIKMIESCILLMKNGLTHYDIKSLNIIIKKISADKNEYESFMIDFGSTFMPQNWDDFGIIVDINDRYLWPIEVYSMMDSYKKFYTDRVKKYVTIKFLKGNKGFMDFSDKVMSYMIGIMFINNFKDNKLKSVIEKMVKPHPDERITLKEALKLIK